MRNLTDKEAVELLDAFDADDDSELCRRQCTRILMAFLRGNDHAKVAEAFEAAGDRAGFWTQ